MKSDCSSSTGSAQLVQPRERLSQRHVAHIVVIQIDEPQIGDPAATRRAGAGEQILDVAAMARAFADHDLARARLQKRRRGAGDDVRVRVDRGVGFVLDHVRLEEHAPAA